MAIVPLPLANQLTNGTTADATQVMADLNAIANAVNSNAASLSSLAASSAPTGASLVGYGGTDLSSFLTIFTANPSTILSINGGPIGDIRNVTINGDMRVDQKNAGAGQTFTAAAALAYCVDQWYGFCTGANITGQRISTNGQNRYRFTGAASNLTVGFGQRMETLSTAYLAGTNATLMAKLSSSSLTTITWALYYASTTDTFGTLASPTRTQIATGTFTINSTEANYTAQIPIPSGATTGLELVLTGGALLATQTLTIGDVALVQSTAGETYFPRRPYGLELMLCKRFLPAFAASTSSESICAGIATSTTAAIAWFPFDVEPYRVPTGIATTGSFFVLNSAAGSITTSSLTYTAASTGKKSGGLAITVASGLTAGNATALYSTTGTLLWTGCQL